MTARRTVMGLVLIVVIAVGGVWWRASWLARHLLRSEAAKTIAEKSGGVYVLTVGTVHVSLARRRIVVDSLHLTTDTAVNARRPRPRTSLHLEFHQCTIDGMRLIPLMLGRGLNAETFGCADVSAVASVPRRPPSSDADTVDESRGPQQAFFLLQQGLRLPSSAPRVHVERIDFPHAELDFRLQRARGGQARLELEHLQWHMTDFTVDPSDSAATARPLFSRSVQLTAADFAGRIDSATAVRVKELVGSVSDSTFEVRGVAFSPAVSDSAFIRARPHRRSLIKAAAGRVAVHGFDVGAMVLREGFRARRVELDSLRVDISSDRRRPPNPKPPQRRTPQRWIAELERSVSVDSVLVRRGEIVYREQRPRQRRPGVMTFARLEAVAVDVRHADGRRRARDPLKLDATAYLQNAGRLDVHVTAPLDAPRFDMTFRGKLGPMRASELNDFIEYAFPLRFDKGQIAEIVFEATVSNGTARGTVTPRYKDLAVEVTGHGAKGILGTGGVIGDAARGVATFVGNLTEIRSDNPEDGEKTLRVGKINHTFAPNETLPAFLWKSIRDGLFPIVKK